VAKILVADDNSNVQKTVTLALTDLGVEVVAVNNGEAAVRKLADISPDLVLADIFMPVRNGYEVCEFVKKDSRFSHIPVVLLVGAFDPLDEREAQRVGADGILKKPFVPPDPLIAMVKTLLDRTLGDRLVGVGASKPAVSMQSKAGGIATAGEHSSPPEISDELPLEEFRPPLDRLSFGEGERPVAFGQLLDTPVQESAASGSGLVEPVDDEQILTSSRDASLGDPIFWRTEEPKEETEEENSEEHPEEHSEEDEDISSGIPMPAWKPDEEAMARTGSDFLQPVESFELVREETDEESGQASTIVESSPLIAQDAASQASLTVDAAKSEDLAANPIEWMASLPPPPAEETPEAAPIWSSAVPEATDDDKTVGLESDDLKTAPAPVALAPSAVAEVPASVSHPKLEPPPFPTPAPPSMKLSAQSAEDTARSIPKQDWADLAGNLQAKSFEPAVEKIKPASVPDAQPPAVTATNSESASMNSATPVSKPQTQNAEDTARAIPKQAWDDLAASFRPKPIEPFAEKLKPASIPVAQPPAATATNSESASMSSATPVSKPQKQNAEDTARAIPKQAWDDLAASFQPRTIDSAVEKPKPTPASLSQVPIELAANTPPEAASEAQTPAASAGNAEPASANSAVPDPALVEAVVQRVLDKMRPQVVDIITKEFLRPVVQALVHREITKR
jgi:CheY-like chemotaxis protein